MLLLILIVGVRVLDVDLLALLCLLILIRRQKQLSGHGFELEHLEVAEVRGVDLLGHVVFLLV